MTDIGKSRSRDKVLTTNLRIEELELGVFTPRLSVDWKYVDELAEDMKANGQQKPIITRPHPEKPNRYQVIDGEYRVRAAKKLGWFLIRAEVRKLTDEEAWFLAMRINQMHGKRLNPVEEAMHIKRMMEKFGYTEAQVAQKFRRSQQWVSQRLSLVERATPELQRALTTMVVKPRHARSMVQLPDKEQKEVLKKVVKHKLPSTTTEALVEAVKVAETEEEKKKVLETVPKLKPKHAKKLVEVFKKAPPEKRKEILEKPAEAIEAFAEVVKTEEGLERALEMAPEKPVMETFECPCGCGYKLVVDWIEQKARWVKPD